MSFKFFNLVVNEVFYPLNFHNYEAFGTKIDPNDVVVDCGASEGAFVVKVKDRCKQVYAIEPSPIFFKSLKKTFLKSNNVTVLPFGILDQKKTMYLSKQDICSTISLSNNDAIRITTTTIDELFYKKNIAIDYLKIDVEGSDVLVLKGAVQTIKKYKPKISVAVYHEASHVKEITTFLKKTEPKYIIQSKGVHQGTGNYVLLHAWVEKSISKI